MFLWELKKKKPFGYNLADEQVRIDQQSRICFLGGKPVILKYDDKHPTPDIIDRNGAAEYTMVHTDVKAQNTACWAFTAARVATRIGELKTKKNTNKPERTEYDCKYLWHNNAVVTLNNLWDTNSPRAKNHETVQAEIGFNQMSYYGYPVGLSKEKMKGFANKIKPLYGVRTALDVATKKFDLLGSCFKIHLNVMSFKTRKFALQTII